MTDHSINAQVRTIVGKKVSRLRKQGIVPITVYGAKIQPLSLQVPYRALEIALMKAGGTSIIDLNADGKTHTVLARDVQRDVLRGTIQHVDFYAVDATTTIRADIPLHYIGESPVVTSRRGILITGTNSITVETLPGKLMDSIEIDLTQLLNIGDAIHVSDLNLGDGIIIINDSEEMLARVSQTSAARAELLEEMEDALPGPSEPELIARGKEEDEE